MSSTLPVSSKSYTQRKYRSRNCRLWQALLSSEYSPLFTSTLSNKIRISNHLGKGHVCIVSRVVNKFYACAYNLRRETNALIHSAIDIFWWEVKGTRVIQTIGKQDSLLRFAKYVFKIIESFITKFYAVICKPELLWCDQ